LNEWGDEIFASNVRNVVEKIKQIRTSFAFDVVLLDAALCV
jgi:hypothetical protein